MATGNKAIVQQFYDEWNAGAIDYERLVHPNVVNHQPDRDPEKGLDLFRKAIDGVMSAVPDSTWTILRLIAGGDFVVCHNRWSGTYGETSLPRYRYSRRARSSRSSTCTSTASLTAASVSTGSCEMTSR